MPMFRGPQALAGRFAIRKRASAGGIWRDAPAVASLIIFRSLWGIGLLEWKGASARTRTWLFATMLAPARSQVSPARPAEPSPGLRRRRRMARFRRHSLQRCR
jgi:hypothetical protein